MPGPCTPQEEDGEDVVRVALGHLLYAAPLGMDLKVLRERTIPYLKA